MQATDRARGCVRLAWDSEFFGRRIARFEGARFTPADGDATRRFCTEHAIDCLYILLDAADTASIATAHEYGARFVDVRMTFEAALEEFVDPVPAPAMPSEVRTATERDLPAMRRIAAVSHHDTRFYADARFDAGRVDLLYQTWIEKSCHGYADAVLVIEAGGEAAGYVTCHLDDGVTGRIGLIAVRQDLRSRGAGVCLLRAARHWFITAGCQSWKVATQGSNIPALRLYEACGFRIAAVQVWLHWWAAETTGERL